MTDFQQHLRERGLNEHIAAWVSQEEEIVRFPVWTIDGKLIGYQRYNWAAGKLRSNAIHGRYITKVNPAYKEVAFWGAEFKDLSPDIIFYTEGVWDAIRIINCGYTCYAIFTCSPSRQLKEHMSLLNRNRRQIMVGDNDDNKAGMRARGFAPEFFLCPKSDPGAMTPEECKEWLHRVANNVLN
jgi:hypothetical protein